jgi:hypothetical protein
MTKTTRMNPYDVREISGYPRALKLFRIPASKYWQVRLYMKGGPSSGVKKSTGCEQYADAVDFAKNWYEERLLEKRDFRLKGAQTFGAFAEKLKSSQQRLIRRGDLAKGMLEQDAAKLRLDVLPALGSLHVSKIDYNIVDDFIDTLSSDRSLSASTLKKYVVLIRKVLKEAEREGVISHLPSLPSIRGVSHPRPWFDFTEYRRLLAACRKLRDAPPEDIKFDFGEMYDFIVFMVHSFLRPSEWKFLQNKHVREVSGISPPQLLLSVPNPKTARSKGFLDSVTTDVAAAIYRKNILKRHDGPNDYLFFNDIKDRDSYVSDRVSRMFRLVCDEAGLSEDRFGQKHTMYSLRHSALCFQIIKTNGTDLFGLAKNARTSVDMLEKFYLSHLSPQLPAFAKQLQTNWAKEL